MSLPHRKGYATADDAMRSKVYLTNPGAALDLNCPCREVHVRLPRTKPLASSLQRPDRRLSGIRRPPGEFSDRVKFLARMRAGDGDPYEARCEACGVFLGRFGGQVQHRLARGSGGSRNPVVRGIENAALLCGNPLDRKTCHGRCEARDPEMERKGWWIRDGNGVENDPRTMPVTLWDGRIRWLGEDGHYSTRPPREVAA